MMFPEFSRSDQNSMKVSIAFLKGLGKRVFGRRRNKVFIIGFHKTGTTSLGKALQILGYRVCGSLKNAYDYKQHQDPKEYIVTKAKEQVKKYDAFQDTPWFLFYKEMYQLYPDAYFILTIRPTDRWLASVQKHFADKRFKYHDLIYDTPNSLECGVHYSRTYDTHNTEVVEFFKEKGNLKVMDVAHAQWSDLGEFLQIRTPKTAFPHANKAKYRGTSLAKVRMWIKKRYYKQTSN